MASIQIHYDGDLITNHQISLRTLGKTLKHLQNSMDRAFLEIEFGQLWKHSKLSKKYYDQVELLVQNPKEGGYILDLISNNDIGKKIINRVSSALKDAVQLSQNEGYDKTLVIMDSVALRKMQIESKLLEPKEYSQLLREPDNAVTRKYADRAIVREINEILSIIRSTESGDSTLEIILSGDYPSKFMFNRENAKRFNSVITRRQLGDPIIYKATVTSMDRDLLKGKMLNIENKKHANLIFIDEKSFQEVIPVFESKKVMNFYGSPFIEYGAFDPVAGDIYFLRMI